MTPCIAILILFSLILGVFVLMGIGAELSKIAKELKRLADKDDIHPPNPYDQFL